MSENNPYPGLGKPAPAATKVPGPQTRPPFEWTLGKVLLCILVGFPVVMIVGVKIIDLVKPQQLDGGREVQCSAGGEKSRDEWLHTRTKEFDDASPYDSGFRGEGRCLLKLVSKNLDCDKSTILTQEKGSPFLRAALERGFDTYVCEKVNDSTRTEYSLRDVYGR